MENQVPQDVVKDRFDRLLAEIQQISSEVTGKYTGRVMEVLVEEENQQDATLVTGRLSNNTVVHFKGDKSLIGKLVQVHLDEAKGFYYMGTLVSEEI
jgi:tRNA-2-methylthio-N6-dimethylallyladenosine synthase